MRWRSCTGGPRGGRSGCILRRCASVKAARYGARRANSTQPPVRERVCGSRNSWRGSATDSGLLDADGGARADVPALCEAVLDLPGSATIPGRSRPVRSAAGAAGPAGPVVPLPSPVPGQRLAGLDRREPDLIPALRRRAAGWYSRSTRPRKRWSTPSQPGRSKRPFAWWETWVRADRQGRTTTGQRWLGRWRTRGGIQGHPMLAVQAAMLAAMTGPPTEAVRWGDVVDRWQYQDAAGPDDVRPSHGPPCSGPACAAAGSGTCAPTPTRPWEGSQRRTWSMPAATLLQGIARRVERRPSAVATPSRRTGSAPRGCRRYPDILADALCERSLVAMARNQWSQAEALAGQARSVLREAGIEDIYTPLLCAVQARAACTAETSQRRGRSSSVLSGCGIC